VFLRARYWYAQGPLPFVLDIECRDEVEARPRIMRVGSIPFQRTEISLGAVYRQEKLTLGHCCYSGLVGKSPLQLSVAPICAGNASDDDGRACALHLSGLARIAALCRQFHQGIRRSEVPTREDLQLREM
jgi:hypothetical protein